MPPRNYPIPQAGTIDAPPSTTRATSLPQAGVHHSLYFRRQEHQFFARAGKEIIHVRVDSDFPPPAGGSRAVKGKEPISTPAHAWASHTPLPPLQALQLPPEHAHAPPVLMDFLLHPVPPYPHHHPDIPPGAPGPIRATGSVGGSFRKAFMLGRNREVRLSGSIENECFCTTPYQTSSDNVLFV